MSIKTNTKKMSSVLVITALTCLNANATSGFNVTSQSAKGSAMADAFVAQADDPSANYYNPAGLTSVKGTQLSGGLIMAYQNEWDFEGDVLNPSTGQYSHTSEAARDQILISPHFYFSHNFDNNFAMGVAVNASYPLSVAWNPGDKLAQLSHENNMLPLTITTNLAYEFEELGLSVAGGISYTYAFVSAEQLLPANVGGMYGRAELEGGDFGYNLGMQWKASDWLTIGATYRAKVGIDLDGDFRTAKFNESTQQWDNSTSDMSMHTNLPAQWIVGAAFKPTKRLTVEVDAICTEFSSYTNSFGNKWEDSYGVRIGGQYALNANWDLRAGVSFDEGPVPEEILAPDMPTNDVYLMMVGFGYHNDFYSVDMSIGNMHIADYDVNNVYNKGTYGTDIQMALATATFKF